MIHFDSYIGRARNISDELAHSVAKTSNEALYKINKIFDFKTHVTGLLLGNVQSGKTAQMLGIIAKMADEGYDIFILLTTDNVYLQLQTFTRANENLTTMRICGENDDLNFLQTRLRKPTLIVLKKNINILKKWKNLLASSGLLNGRPLVFVDDEADAASLNTLVNKSLISQINKHILAIKNLSASSIYLQVTATPQAIILQSNLSGFKPKFIQYFEPGNNYIGGDFIYSQPRSYCIKPTPENELDDIKKIVDYVPLGLKKSLLTFLVISAEFKLRGNENCNFLVHPSVRITDHETFANLLGENLNSFIQFLDDDSSKKDFIKELHDIWTDLQSTQPDLNSFDDIQNTIEGLLNNMDYSIYILNSRSPLEINYNRGYNIIVGGNSLGRGVTLPNLQVVYYCRKSKVPQADTFWQHSRIFGYDRIKGLIRVFLPLSLLDLFTEINISNRILVNQVVERGLDGLQLLLAKNIRPTRKNVLDNQAMNVTVGGVNFFATDPVQQHTKHLDLILKDYSDQENYIEVQATVITDILRYVDDNAESVWDSEKYSNCLNALRLKRPNQKFCLIIRRDRNISKGTGTLLSPTDRLIGERLKDFTVLTLYRLNGATTNGWAGKAFWAPNIRFPDGYVYYDTINL